MQPASSSATVKEYLDKAGPALSDLFETVRAFCEALGNDVQQKTLKRYFAFKRLKNFACIEVHPQSEELLLYLKADFGVEKLRQRIEQDEALRDARQIGHYGTGGLELRLRTEDDFERTQDLIARSYEKS